MSYITIQARDQAGHLLYEKDTGVGIFQLVATYLATGLRLQGLMSQHESYRLLVTPRFDSDPEFRDPRILNVSEEEQLPPPGVYLVMDTKTSYLDHPVDFFSFALISQNRLYCCWDVCASELGYVKRTVKGLLTKGGYIAPDQEITCEYLVQQEGMPEKRERFHIQPRPEFEFRVIRQSSKKRDLPLRQLADYPHKERIGLEIHKDAPAILINRSVLRQIFMLAKEGSTKPTEVAGLLIGQAYGDPQTNQLLIDIHDLVPAKVAPSTVASVHFTEEAIDQLDRIKENLFPQALKMGWYHSHPASPVANAEGRPQSGVFFSEMDRQVHNQFREPWHVALVVDGLGRDARFYRWKDESCEEIVESQGFYVYQTEAV